MLLFAIAVGLALAFGASSAQAAPLSMTFTEARANVGVQLSDAALFEAPDTAPLDAQIDPVTGAITDGSLDVPDFQTHITDPIDADVTVQFAIGTITGSFDGGTGSLSLSGTAGGTLTATGKQCTVATIPSSLTLTTAGSSGGANPRSGAPFASGLVGPGAIAGQWTDMTASAVNPGDPDNVTFCNNVEGQIGGPGGVWLQQAGEEPPGPGAPPGNPPAPGGTQPTGQRAAALKKCAEKRARALKSKRARHALTKPVKKKLQEQFKTCKAKARQLPV